MRVATFNTLHGQDSADGVVDLDRFAAAVTSLDADVLALQEVDRDQPRSHGADLTEVAAAAMGARAHRFAAAMAGTPGAGWVPATGAEPPGGAAYGVAVLSRLPVVSWEVVRLPALRVRTPYRFPGQRRPTLVRDEARVALAARVRAPDGDVTVVGTHLSFLPWSNGRQLRALVLALAPAARPLVLAGDLNLGPRRAVALTGMRPAATAATYPAHAPRQQIDHVLLDGPLTATAGGTRRLPMSDHLALAADLA